ncbi:DUF1554 domain-containing protein [Leptospira perdikensis]|uniref:DUF1554 domain-containing protein n=1 Tax=Leptospira perdikensis TaxID=2484948 RepID=A0A4R9JKH0_9LEPT|nr:DUF1554 domain-containing protein [Leptospira perdikensis]TGL44778.1 DUF1554 domain-containing protein [Leptospira perdikensis]
MIRYLFIVLVFVSCNKDSLNNACDISSDSYLKSVFLFNLVGESKSYCSTGMVDLSPSIIVVNARQGSVSEGGGSLTIGSSTIFNVTLKEIPGAKVDIQLSISHPSYATVSPSELSFDSTNWSKPQNIQVTGINDSVANGNRPFRVTLVPTSEDSSLDLNPREIQMQISDNEKRLFLSASTYQGGGFGGVSGADAICASDIQCPPGSICKAMILNGTTRVASATANLGDGQIDWVLKPNAHYYLSDGVTLVSNTNGTSLFQFPFTTAVDSVNYGTWFGGVAGWIYDTNTSCFTWTAVVNTESGYILRTQQTSNLFLGATYACNNLLKLLCVEQ